MNEHRGEGSKLVRFLDVALVPGSSLRGMRDLRPRDNVPVSLRLTYYEGCGIFAAWDIFRTGLYAYGIFQAASHFLNK